MRVPGRRLSSIQVVALLAGAISLLAVAALASRAHIFGETPPPLPAAASRLVIDSLFYLALVLEAAVLVFMVWILWPDDQARPLVKRRSLWQTLVTPLAVVAVVGLVLLLRDRLQRGAQLRQLGGAGAAASGANLNPVGGVALNSHSGLDWMAFAVVAVILGLVLGWLLYRRQRQRLRQLRQHRRLAAELEEVMSEGLQELALDADPRRAVIAAYARMERVLALHGRPRRSAEAPFEYVQRLLGEVPLSRGLLVRLTDLYQQARFSTHEIDLGMREQALNTLEAIRGELRAITSEGWSPTGSGGESWSRGERADRTAEDVPAGDG